MFVYTATPLGLQHSSVALFSEGEVIVQINVTSLLLRLVRILPYGDNSFLVGTIWRLLYHSSFAGKQHHLLLLILLHRCRR